MELLPFRMPPYARTVWASKDIKDVWKPKLNQAARAYSSLERLTVIHGLRRATTLHVTEQDMMHQMQRLAQEGLSYVPMLQVGAYSGFAHTHPPVIPGKPWTYYGAIAKHAEDAHAFAAASAHTEETQGNQIDHEAIGKLLGYPDCCRNFFNNVWGAGYIDPIWQQAENCKPENLLKREEHLIQIGNTIPPETSVMLRYIGIRVLPHIPCSHDCQHSLQMAKDWVQLGRDVKLDGLEELMEFLNLPVEWDCMKGIAYVSTPIFKIETNSMTCYPKYVVQKEGTLRPKESPGGLKFPHIPIGSEKYAHLFGAKSNC
jgi:hypothetical protein